MADRHPDDYSPCANKEEAKNFACVFAAMLLGGVGALAWGMYEMGNEKADAVRWEHVHTYNDAVDRWTAGGRAAFKQASNISIWGWYDGEHHPVTLLPVQHKDALLDHGTDLESFDGLHYEYRGPIAISDESDGGLGGWQQVSGNLSVAAHGAAAGGLRWPTPLMPGPTALTKSDVFRTGNWKQCQFHHHGSLDRNTHTCTTYRALSSFCFTMKRDGGGVWRPTAHGCGFPAGTHPIIPVYAVVPAPRFETRPAGLPRTHLREVHITARAESDPYLIAMNVTHGSSDFGQTRSQRVALGVIGITLGCVLLAAAATLGFCFLRGIGCYQPPQSDWDRQQRARTSHARAGSSRHQQFGAAAEQHDNELQNGHADRRRRTRQRVPDADPDSAGVSGMPIAEHDVDVEMQKAHR